MGVDKALCAIRDATMSEELVLGVASVSRSVGHRVIFHGYRIVDCKVSDVSYV